MKKALLMALVAIVLASSAVMASPKQIEGVLNINTASVEQLTLLPGIGAAKAQAIAEYRKAHPFKATEELTEIKGIGPKMLEKLAKYVAVEGATTLQEVSPSK